MLNFHHSNQILQNQWCKFDFVFHDQWNLFENIERKI